MNRRHSSPFGILLVLGSMVSITSGASLAKTLFDITGPAGISVIRIGVASLLLGILWRPWNSKLTPHQLKRVVLYGLCLGLMNLLFYMAISRLPLGLAIAIEFLGPLGVALAFSRRALDLLWAALAGAGIILILPFHQISMDVDPLGIVFALGAAAMWACYILVGKRVAAMGASGMVTSIGMAVAFLSVMPFGYRDATQLLNHPNLIPIALGVGILSSAIPYSLEMIALRSLSENHFGLLMSLEPAVGAVIAYFILGESLSPTQLVAVGLVMSASIGSSLVNRRPPEITTELG